MDHAAIMKALRRAEAAGPKPDPAMADALGEMARVAEQMAADFQRRAGVVEKELRRGVRRTKHRITL